MNITRTMRPAWCYNYADGLTNGSLGVVSEIDEAGGTVAAVFDGVPHVFDGNQQIDLQMPMRSPAIVPKAVKLSGSSTASA